MVTRQRVVLEHRVVGILEFVEPIDFYSDWKDLGLDDDDLGRLQIALMEDPDAGDLIQGTGGVRKIRFAGKQRGKRGGTRIVYVHLKDRNAIALFMAYGKNVKDNLNSEDKKVLKELIAEIKRVIPLKGKRNGKRK